MATKTDIRQFISRDVLSRLTGVSGSQLDEIIRSINSETTPPFALSVTGTSRVVTIANQTLANPSTALNRAILSNGGQYMTFTSATVTLSATGAGSATPSSGSVLSLGMAASQFMYVQASISKTGTVVLSKGTAASTSAAATVPARSSGNFPVGYFLVTTDASNNVANVVTANLFQFAGFMPDAVSLTGVEAVTNKTFDATSTMTGVRMGSFTPDGTNTLTAPAVTDTLGVVAAAQSPTNKTFDSTSTMTGVRMASFTPDGTHTLTAPTVTDTLVVATAAQTLSNKTQQTLLGAFLTDASTTGSDATLQNADIGVAVVRLTNTGLVTLGGIPAGGGGQILVVENQTTNPVTILDNDTAVVTAANRIRTGTGGAVTMQSNATFIFTYDSVVSRWMLTGGSGSGSGSGNTLLETLKNQFVDSPYQLLTPNVISTDGQSKFSSLSGATYDLSTNTIKFSANAQVATSTNLLDVAEFNSQGVDIGQVDLTALWNLGSTIQAFSVPTGFTYEISRDGGTNWFTAAMSQVGTTNAFAGSLRFDTTTTTEATKQTTSTIAVTSGNQNLNTGPAKSVSQAFTLTSTTKIQEITLNMLRFSGTPVGNFFISIIKDASGSPSLLASDVLSQTAPINIPALGLTTGYLPYVFSLSSVVLTPGTYHIVLTSDAAYKAGYTANNTNVVFFALGTSTPAANVFDGTSWSSLGGTFALGYTLKGRALDLRVRLTSAGSPTYPCGLDGFGIFYNIQDVGVVGATRKTQRFAFNSVTDNLSSFTISGFNPDPDLLTCYYVEGGQSFKVPSFALSGNVATFPTNSFNNGGVSSTVTLIFDQNSGGAFDNSDVNARLMAANHLGSTNGTDDRSTAGRGIILRRPDGTLRELFIDNNDNISILSVP